MQNYPKKDYVVRHRIDIETTSRVYRGTAFGFQDFVKKPDSLQPQSMLTRFKTQFLEDFVFRTSTRIVLYGFYFSIKGGIKTIPS